jgi:hypothetical protein
MNNSNVLRNNMKTLRGVVKKGFNRRMALYKKRVGKRMGKNWSRSQRMNYRRNLYRAQIRKKYGSKYFKNRISAKRRRLWGKQNYYYNSVRPYLQRGKGQNVYSYIRQRYS